MDAPNYVQGLYTVAQRDEIFAKAAKYPDAADGLQNQVPTIFPDGTVGWRQIPEGGDGTANANIAVVEPTQYASKDYSVSDYLIFDGQLYRVVRPIAAGEQLNASSAVGPINISTTRVDRELFPMFGKGRQLLRNWLFCDDGEFPINQRGNTVYTGAGPTIDGWMLTGGTLELRALSGMLGLTAPENQYCDFYQIVDDSDLAPTGGVFSFSLMINGGLYSGHANLAAAGIGNEVVVYEDNRLQLVLENLSSAKIKVTIRMFAGKSANLIAAKLEMGYKSTLAIRDGYSTYLLDPLPDYGEEMAKCQRYYYRRHYNNTETIGSGVAVGAWGSALLQIGVGQQMASDYPTCKITGTVGLSPSVTISGSVPATPTASLSGTTANITFPSTVTKEGSFYAYANDANGVDFEFEVSQ